MKVSIPPARGPNSLVTKRTGLETASSNQWFTTETASHFHARAETMRTGMDMGARLASPKPLSQPHNAQRGYKFGFI